MKKLAIILRTIANKLCPVVNSLDSPVELEFPERNMSFNRAIDSLLSQTDNAREHFYRRLVLRIPYEDLVKLDSYIEVREYEHWIKTQKRNP